MAGPTVINVEADADLVIKKGEMTVHLSPDGSVTVNGVTVQAPSVQTPSVQPAAPAAPVSEPVAVLTPQPVTAPPPPVDVATTPIMPPTPAPVAEAPAAPAVDPEEAARLQAEEVRSRKERFDQRKAELITRFKAEGMPPVEAAQKAMAQVMAEIDAENEQRALGGQTAAPAVPAAPVVATSSPAATLAQTVPVPAAPVADAAATAVPTITTIAPVTVAAPASDNYAIGQTVEGKGVFVGLWRPIDKAGRLDGSVYNVFAAPEDLTDAAGDKVMLSFNDAAKRVGELKDWHGHDGGNYANDEEFYKDLRKGKYHGEWIIPPSALLADDNGKAGILTASQYQGDMEDTFVEVGGLPSSRFYWSSTETKEDPDYVYYANFVEGQLMDYMGRANNKLATRPVRIEPK